MIRKRFFKVLSSSFNYESAKLRVLCAKSVLTCQRALVTYGLACQWPCVFYVLTCQRVLRPHVLTCQHALRVYVLKFQRALRAYVLTCQRDLRAYVLTCSRTNVLVLMLLFSVSLPLLLKMYTLLIRFKSLIIVFPQ